MELSKRIEKIVEYSGLSIPKFAEFVGFKTPQAVRELIKGNTKTLSFQAQEKIISSLGLNMIEPYKPLIDSGLAAFLIFDSNKSAPKRHQKPPRSSLTVAAPLITPKHLL